MSGMAVLEITRELVVAKRDNAVETLADLAAGRSGHSLGLLEAVRLVGQLNGRISLANEIIASLDKAMA